LSYPPDQNNVTLDIAILSQLTPAVRSYGTDCNQTAMVLEAMDRLGLGSTMKLWLGVYLDGNVTTNARQIAQMYDILDQYPASRFAGIIVGNEVLFSQYLSATDLATQLQSVRTTLTAKGIALTVSTADLGEQWKKYPDLATYSDIVMANVHPFFSGVKAAQGESWAWTYWQGITALSATATGAVGGVSYPKQIIGEIGWPSQGGHHCGGEEGANFGCVTSDDGAVASVANMNTFMDDWVCQALSNGTNYFWFEAFDEPWKHRFDTALNKWEPYWGLMDVNRNLKKGLVIPDCGGATVKGPYF
jgi:exo-beta-1,3-glucanase (GH17 family)